jgi:hypothetical protein
MPKGPFFSDGMEIKYFFFPYHLKNERFENLRPRVYHIS